MNVIKFNKQNIIGDYDYAIFNYSFDSTPFIVW